MNILVKILLILKTPLTGHNWSVSHWESARLLFAFHPSRIYFCMINHPISEFKHKKKKDVEMIHFLYSIFNLTAVNSRKSNASYHLNYVTTSCVHRTSH